MEPNEESPAVEVTVIEAPEVVSEPTPEVVVVEADSSDAMEAVVVETTIDQAERIALLEAQNAELLERVQSVEYTAASAQSTADVALDEALETTDEVEFIEADVAAVEEQLEDVVQPETAKPHPLFRSWKDWMEK